MARRSGWKTGGWTCRAHHHHHHLSTAGPHYTNCRWYSWAQCFAHGDRCHHSRLLIMLYWGIEEGLVTPNSETKALALLNLKQKAPEKETMKAAKTKAQGVRTQGRNLLHVSLLLMRNPNLQRQG